MGRRMYYHVLGRLGTDFSVVTYVPQSRKKSMKRGYCPAELLAKELSSRMKLPRVQVLQRIGDKEQKYVKKSDRFANAKQNYALRKDAKISGRVLLVDDLMTTGSTLNACAELLLKAGAEEVFCVTFAIAGKKS